LLDQDYGNIQFLVYKTSHKVGFSTKKNTQNSTPNQSKSTTFSTQTGIISSWYDFAIMLAVFPVCHWGNIGENFLLFQLLKIQIFRPQGTLDWNGHFPHGNRLNHLCSSALH
jgi:hypothetical protein